MVSDMCDTPENSICDVEKSLNFVDEYPYESGLNLNILIILSFFHLFLPFGPEDIVITHAVCRSVPLSFSCCVSVQSL